VPRLLAALVSFVIGLAPIVAHAQSPRTPTVLVAAEPDAPESAAIEGDLRGLALRPVIVAVPVRAGAPAIEALADDLGADAAIHLSPARDVIDVRTRDGGTWVLVESVPRAPSPEDAALRAIEIVRARITPPASAPTPDVVVVERTVEVERTIERTIEVPASAPPRELAIGASAAALWMPDQDAGLLVSLALAYRPDRWLGLVVGAHGAVVPTLARGATHEGAIASACALLSIAARVHLLAAEDPIQLDLDVGALGGLVIAEGRAVAPFRAATAIGGAIGPLGAISIAWAPIPVLRMRASATIGASLAPISLEIEQLPIGRWGEPLLSLGAGIEVRP
jgi:hypothetical protein